MFVDLADELDARAVEQRAFAAHKDEVTVGCVAAAKLGEATLGSAVCTMRAPAGGFEFSPMAWIQAELNSPERVAPVHRGQANGH